MTDATSTGPVTIEEIADRLAPGDPRISGDGRHVAFTVAMRGRKEDRFDRAIWVSTDGAPARRFTTGSGDHTDLAWSPDSDALAFVAQREKDDKSRLYRLPIGGGEAQQVGDIEGKLSAPAWSPDGTRIAVLVTDEETGDEKKRKEEKRDVVVFEEEDKVTRLWTMDVESGEKRCLTHGHRHVWEYAWSDDGEHLILITGDKPTFNQMFLASQLRVIPATGGTSRLLAETRNIPSHPVVRTIDGEKTVFFLANDHRADPSYSVWSIGMDGRNRRKVTDNERSAAMKLAADPRSGSGLLLLQADHSTLRLYTLDGETGALEPVDLGSLAGHGSVLNRPSMSSTGVFAVSWSALGATEEVYHVTPEGEATKLTSFGDTFDGRLANGEVVSWESDDGVDVEGLLIYPRDYEAGTRYPLVLQVHGGPAWLWTERLYMTWHDWAQMLAAKGYAVLLPNPRGSIGYGTSFEQLLQDDVGGGESHDLVSGALAMVERGIADADRLAITGWSWGGYLTAWTITQTDIFKAAVMGAGVANNVSDHGAGDIAEYNPLIYPDHPYREEAWDSYTNVSPVRYASRVTTPTLIVHGEKDDRVHVTQGQEFYRALQVCGVPVQFVRYPREAHGFVEYNHQIDLMERICGWLEKYLSTVQP
jgi:dipeptidyl aminopeptidase/acylaminoacyl peptidase